MGRYTSNKEVKSLQKKKQNAITTKNYREASTYSRELAEYYKTNGYECYDDAMKEYNECILLCRKASNYEDISYCYRGLCDIHIDNGDYKKAMEEINHILEIKDIIRNPGIIQLAKHQKAYIYFQSYQNGNWNDNSILRKALEEAKDAERYLDSVSGEIDKSKKMIEAGGDSRRRKAGLIQLLGDIYADLQMVDIAENNYNLAMNYFKNNNENIQLLSCLYSIYLIKKGENKYEIAKRMYDVSEKMKDKKIIGEKAKARFYYGVECGKMKKFDNAKDILYKVYKDHNIGRGFKIAARKIIIYMYKYEERIKNLDEKDDYEKMKIYELLGDEGDVLREEDISELDEVGKIRFDEISLECYKKMLSFTRNDTEKKLALQSIAILCLDMELFDEALINYDQLLKLEKNGTKNIDKINEYELQILNCQSKMKELDPSLLRRQYNKKLFECTNPSFRKLILEGYIDFLNKYGEKDLIDSVALEKYRKEYEDLMDQENDNSDSPMNERFLETNIDAFEDIFVDYTDDDIFERIETKIKEAAERERLLRDIDKKINQNGECLLHELAKKKNGWKEMIKLIECNYNVNVIDYGGWTPLSEAVSHDHYDNAAFLLKHGAIVDCTSKESVLEGEEKVASEGLTPLMEAAQKGNIKMMKLLLKYGASVVKENSEGNNAFDYLKLYFEDNKEDLNNMEKVECTEMIFNLEKKIKNCGGKIKEKANPVVSDERVLLPKIIETREHVSEDKANYLVYKSTINSVGRKNEDINLMISKNTFNDDSDGESEDEIVIDLAMPDEFNDIADVYNEENISPVLRKRKNSIGRDDFTQVKKKIKTIPPIESSMVIESNPIEDIVFNISNKSESMLSKDSGSSTMSSASSHGIRKVNIDFEFIEAESGSILHGETNIRKEKNISIYELEKLAKSFIYDKYTSITMHMFDEQLRDPKKTLEDLLDKSNACKIIIKLEGWQPTSLIDVYEKTTNLYLKPSIRYRINNMYSSLNKYKCDFSYLDLQKEVSFFEALSKWLPYTRDSTINLEGCDLSDEEFNQQVDMSFIFSNTKEINLKCTHLQPIQIHKIIASLSSKPSMIVQLDLSFNSFNFYGLNRLLTLCPLLDKLIINSCTILSQTEENVNKFVEILKKMNNLCFVEIQDTLAEKYHEKIKELELNDRVYIIL
uniref:ANK_REP_REGION domain-containing protein n=1 Tax=Parastrongyloides trichosuri TaxID=131310 RepID=A0A0N4ZZ99_PARTI